MPERDQEGADPRKKGKGIRRREEPSGVGEAECWNSWSGNWREPIGSVGDANGNLAYKQRTCEVEGDAQMESRMGS